jgi:hypothetical protein
MDKHVQLLPDKDYLNIYSFFAQIRSLKRSPQKNRKDTINNGNTVQ